MSSDAHKTVTRRRPTQADIARGAGVSQATVSLILADAAGVSTRIPRETRERVLAVSAELGYAPNAAAQSLVGGRTHLLAFHTFEAVFPADQHDFYVPFLQGVEKEASRRGYDLLLLSPVSEGHGAGIRGPASRIQLADGCILLGRHVDYDTVAELTRNDFPFVVIGRRAVTDADVAFVGADYAGATEDLVRRLADLGHTRLGYIGEPERGEQSQDRLDGYFAGIHSLDDGGAASLKHSKPLTTEELRRWLDREITGVIVEPGDDDTNIAQLEQSAAELGIRIPEDLSVAVSGDPDFHRSTREWTRFQLRREQMAEQAVALLAQLLEGDNVDRHQVVGTDFHPGETIAGPRP